jgi:hypothetical protein
MKISKILLSLLLTFTSSIVCAQNIIDILRQLPNREGIPNKEILEQRIDLYNKGENPKNSCDFQFITIDIKNGYVKYYQCESTSTVCYWNTSDGNQLIAVSHWSCGGVCGSEWRFYKKIKSNNSITEVSKIFPNFKTIKSAYFDIDLMKKENSHEEFKQLERELYLNYTVSLPQNGKNILLYFEHNTDSIDERIRFKKDLKGIELIWKDGVFIFGDWITE